MKLLRKINAATSARAAETSAPITQPGTSTSLIPAALEVSIRQDVPLGTGPGACKAATAIPFPTRGPSWHQGWTGESIRDTAAASKHWPCLKALGTHLHVCTAQYFSPPVFGLLCWVSVYALFAVCLFNTSSESWNFFQALSLPFLLESR